MKVNIKNGQLAMISFFLPFATLFFFFSPGLEGFYRFLELIQKFLL